MNKTGLIFIIMGLMLFSGMMHYVNYSYVKDINKLMKHNEDLRKVCK